ncbi:MAG: chemotaxis protein CheB [Pyrinomonadaceae bacterium]
MAKKNIVVTGGSSGSFEVFKAIASGLPAGLDASIFIVWHMSPGVRGVLPQVLNNVGRLPASEAEDGDRIETGRIYVARPDHHLLVEDGVVRVTRGPKENRFRPAIDPLFRSAAFTYGPRVVGVVTSGALDDGTSGLWTIKHYGGTAIVQDPSDAETASMPESAIREVRVDHIVPLARIAELIVELSAQEADGEAAAVRARDDVRHARTALEIQVAGEQHPFELGVSNWGELSPIACPECRGVLSRISEDGRPRFRCHTGHAYSADSLLAVVTENIEKSLWEAVRGIDESVMLLDHLGDHFAEINQPSLAARFFRKSKEAARRNDLIRQVVFGHEDPTALHINSGPTEGQVKPEDVSEAAA